MNYDEAYKLVGGLGRPSKMPCLTYSLPIANCKTGQRLMKKEGSICSKCYANRGHYLFDVVQMALQRRLQAIENKNWVDAMVYLIEFNSQRFFRWHDSGDIQSLNHLHKICQVAERTPEVKHWLPTREYEIIKKYRKHHEFPDNLIVRLSAEFFELSPPIELAKELGVQVSGASKKNYDCPASEQGNHCGLCRKCWDKDTFNVIYKRH